MKQELCNYNNLVCPDCKGTLDSITDMLVCTSCKLQWSVKDNIPDFSHKTIITSYNTGTKEMDQLIQSAQNEGWQTALFNYNKNLITNDCSSIEDQRVSDWRFIIPIEKNHTILVLGCGLGVIPIALSEHCKTVYAIDPEWGKAAFLNVRKGQLGINNIFPIQGDIIDQLPFNKESVDLVVMVGSQYSMGNSYNFTEFTKQVYTLLKDDGGIYFCLDNKFFFQPMIRNLKSMDANLKHSIFGYKRILKEKNFLDIKIYAPLPQHDKTPMFYLPLDNNYAIRFFFKNIFPLFEMVTPEVKRAYGVQYILIKIVVKLAILFRLTVLAKFFVPGFAFIAKK